MKTKAEVYPVPGMRRCPCCRTTKPLAEFGGKNRIESYCRVCKATNERKKRASLQGVIRPEDCTRFWSRVKKGVPGPLDTPCWIWQGAPRNADGYGQFHITGRNLSPHLVALMFVGRVATPEAPLADHLCKVRMCVNPDHLRFVDPRISALENCESPSAKNARKEHCPQGHPYTPENTMVILPKRAKNRHGNPRKPGKARACLTCYRAKHPGAPRKSI